MKQRKVTIGGDEYEIMDEGNCFIETNRKRYSWGEGELRLFAVREKLGKPGKDGKRKPELAGWGYDRFTGRDILELYGPDYDKGRGHECWIRFARVDQPVKLPAPRIEAVPMPVPVSELSGRPSRKRRHGPDNRKPYNRRTNPELGNQLRAWFRSPENKDATINAGAKWAASLFDRKGGPLGAFRLPCPSVLWREAKKQKPMARFQR